MQPLAQQICSSRQAAATALAQAAAAAQGGAAEAQAQAAAAAIAAACQQCPQALNTALACESLGEAGQGRWRRVVAENPHNPLGISCHSPPPGHCA